MMYCNFRPSILRQSLGGLQVRVPFARKSRTLICNLISSRFYNQNEDTLPRLPVPPLKQTLCKYLETVKPLVDNHDYDHTHTLVKEFGRTKGRGEELQQLLLERAKHYDNWLSNWWLDCAYLESRATVVIHCSPAVSFPKYDFAGVEGQIRHAAKVISGVIAYKSFIDEESLPVEKMGKAPLCMDQYRRLLSSCRVPGLKKDAVNSYAQSNPTHIVVIHNNQFFQLHVYASDGSALNIPQLESQLSRIVADSLDRAPAVGILTTQDRDRWAKSYTRLCESKKNIALLNTIQQSIFAICLDGDSPTVPDIQWRSDMAARGLHGGGSSASTGNRWFDKTIQMVVDRNGGVGLVYEHSPAEGPPIAAMLDHVYQYCEQPLAHSNNEILSLPRPHKLEFHITDDLMVDIDEAGKTIDGLIASTNVEVAYFYEFGKDFIKSQKLSPDSFIQVAFQLAFYRIHRRAPSTYESASLRRFHLGRTDTIRSCSSESDAFVKCYVDASAPPHELNGMLRDAVAAHKRYATDAVSGNGIDRHLLGLKLAAVKRGEPVPELFKDATYQRAMHFNLSTSQVACKADLCMAFGPAVRDGYGVCYNPKSDRVLFSVSAADDPHYEVKRFRDEVKRAFCDMRDLLVHGGSKL